MASILKVFFPLLILLLSFSLKAQNYWTGATNSNWSEGSNWTGGLPATDGTEDIVFRSAGNVACNIDANIDVNTITIESGYTATITQNSGVTIDITDDFNQSDGTFSSGDSYIDIDGDFIQSAGTYTSTSSSLLINDEMLVSGGTWSHNNGKVVSNAGVNNQDWDFNSSIDFYDFEVSNSNNKSIRIGQSDIINISNSLTLTNGLINSANLTNYGKISLASGATFSLAAGFDGGTGVIYVDHARTETLPDNSDSPGWELNHASATINAGLNQEIEGHLIVTNGTFDDQGNEVTFRGDFALGGSGTFTNTGNMSFLSNNNSTFDVDGTLTITGDLTINKNNNRNLDLGSGDVVTVNGTLTLTNGDFDVGTFKIGASGTVAVGAGFDGGNGTVLLDQAKTLNIVSGAKLPGITLNHASASITYDASASATIEGLLDIQNGTFNAPAGGTATFSGSISQSGGTFNGSNATLDINSNVTLTGGTFNATSGTINYSGASMNINATAAGNYSHNNGNFKFDDNQHQTVTLGANTTFNSIEIGFTQNKNLTISGGFELIASGDLTLSEGQLNSGAIRAQADIIETTTFDGGLGIIHINNGASRTINLTVGNLRLPTIQLNDANATVNFTNVAADSIYIEGNIDIDAGTMNAQATPLLITGTIDISGGTFTQSSGEIQLSNTFTMSGGTFTGGSGELDFDNNFTLSGGSFTSTSGNFTFTGSTFTTTGAPTFTHNNGHVLFAKTGNSITTLLVSTIDLNEVTVNLIHSNNGKDNLIISGSDIIANGDLHLLDGEILTGTIQSKADISASESFSGGTGILHITGGASRTINLNPGTFRLPSLRLNDANATLNLTDDGAKSVTLEGELDLDAGTLNVKAAGLVLTNVDISGGTLNIDDGKFDASGTFTQSAGTVTQGSGEIEVTGAYTHNGGTFTGGAGMKDFQDTFSQSAGTYNQGSGELQVDDPYTHSGGTFNGGSGEIDITSTFTQSAGDFTTGTGIVGITGAFALSGSSNFNATNTSTFTLGGAYTQTDATSDFVASSGDLDFNSSFSLTDGDFTATSGNFTIEAAFTTAGTSNFIHNNGTVIFDNTNNDQNLNLVANTTFNNLTVNLTGVDNNKDELNINNSDAIVIGTLGLTDGRIKTGTIQLQGDISSNENFDGGNGTINITGGGTRTINIDAGTFEIPKLIINDANATINFSNSGGKIVTIEGQLDIDNGTVNILSSELEVQGAVDISGGTLTTTSGTADFQSTFNQSAGTLTAGSGNIDVGGNFTQSGGTFTAPSGSLLLDDDMTISGGTFVHNNGTVEFDGSNDGDLNLTAGSQTFNNLTFNNASGDGGNDDFYVNTNIAIVTGTLGFTQGELRGGTIQSSGDITITENWQGGRDTELLHITGGATRTINLTAGTYELPETRVDDANVTINLTNDASKTVTVEGTLNLINGTINGGIGNLLINTNLDIDGGTFTSTSGILEIDDIFTKSGGTFNHNNGTVLFTSNDHETWVSNNASETFYNLTIAHTRDRRLRLNFDLDIENDLLISGDGYLDVNVNDIDINLGGDFTITSTSTTKFVQGANGETVTLDGASGTQTINSNGATETFENLVINHTGSGVAIASPIAVDNNLDLTAGIVNSTAVNKITMNSGTSVSNASDASYVDGYIEKIGNTDFTFPVGDDGNYQPISVSSITGSTSDAFIATYLEQSADDAGYDTNSVSGIHHVSTCEYWILNQSVNAPTARVQITYDANSCGVTDVNELEIARWNGTSWTKEDATATGDNNSGTILTNVAVTSFSPFAPASNTNDNPLPVSLLSFNAKLKQDEVHLNWSTATEINNDYFTIERSNDGTHYKELDQAIGAGNSNSRIDYHKVDKKPLNGISYYRLKQTDFDGNSEVFEPVSIHYVKSLNEYILYPNPISTNGTLNLELDEIKLDTKIQLVELRGKLIYSDKLITGQSKHSIDLSALNISSGIYMLTLSSDLDNQKVRIVIN